MKRSNMPQFWLIKTPLGMKFFEKNLTARDMWPGMQDKNVH